MSRLAHNHAARHAAHFVAGFVALFVGGDLILSLMRLPITEGSTNMVRRKWEMLQDFERQPDVVILGSSFEEFGVNPEVLDEHASATLGRTVTSFNLAVPAASLNTEFLIVRNMLRSGCTPKVIYLGITPLAVDIAQKDWLNNGLRAFGEFQDLAGAWSTDRQAFGETLATSLFQSYFLWNDARLVSERFVLAAPIESVSAADRSERGWRAWRGKKRPQCNRPDPADSDPANLERRFALDNINGLRIRDAIESLRKHGIKVRLLELPLASTALPMSAPSKNSRYRTFVEELLAKTGVPLIRPPADLLVDDDYFDDGHLTPSGAERLSRWLAEDVVAALAERGSRVAAR